MLRLPAIFKSGAVFQRDKIFRVWGESDCKSIDIKITSEDGDIIADVSVETSDGKFMAELNPIEAGGPFLLKISGPCEAEAVADENTIVLQDVYFGDVWLAGGQSNMEFELQNSKDAHEEIENCSNDRIRFYQVPRVAWTGKELEEAEGRSEWEKCTPDNVGKWSAVGYYFAKTLTEESEGIMIGIIGCNWGGTSASAWISREKLLEYKETAQYVDEYDEITKDQNEADYIKEYEDYVVYQAEFDRRVGEYYQTCPNPSWDEAIALFGENKYPGPMGPRNWSRPYGLYETMIKRITPYGLMGCIFYQGENDDNRPYSYYRLLTSLVEQWRVDFMDDKLAFVNAQLPIFVNEGEDDHMNWPFIREAQAKVARESGNGLAVILEAGEYHNIHPLNKETVGCRLAFQALYNVYGCMTKWDACGPEYDSSFVIDGAMYVDLRCCESGLMINGDDDFIEDVKMMDYLPADSGFEIAGEDKVFYKAKAQVLRGEYVEDDSRDSGHECDDESDMYEEPDEPDNAAASLGSILSIKLTADEVPSPKYGRYFWKNFGKVRIFGSNGIPLEPFRTSENDGSVALGSRQGDIIDVLK